MTDIESMNDKELREIVLSQSNAICRLIRQLEAQETISQIQKMAMLDYERRATTPVVKNIWKHFAHGRGAPYTTKRYIVKLATGWICCAAYTYKADQKSDGKSCWQWQNDNGSWINEENVIYWKELEE